MKNRFKTILITALVLIAVAIVSAWYWMKIYDNYHVVIEGELYRSAQLGYAEFQKYISIDDLKTVVNLRDDTNSTWWFYETGICERMDVKHIDFPLGGNQRLTIDQMNNLVETMANAESPMLIHCKHGADRTALAVALYLNNKGIKHPEEAFSAKYGHLPMLFKSVQCFDKSFENYMDTSDL
jgi:protein tyrosine phosphatase (PTP) superfamily phosphohydrolase (DUF442 family)